MTFNFDKSVLAQTAAEAKNAVISNVTDLKQRVQWLRAIDRAYAMITNNQIEIKLVQSSTYGYQVEMKSSSGSIYQVGPKHCTCAAGLAGMSYCKHKSAWRLIQRAQEKQSKRLTIAA